MNYSEWYNSTTIIYIGATTLTQDSAFAFHARLTRRYLCVEQKLKPLAPKGLNIIAQPKLRAARRATSGWVGWTLQIKPCKGEIFRCHKPQLLPGAKTPALHVPRKISFKINALYWQVFVLWNPLQQRLKLRHLMIDQHYPQRLIIPVKRLNSQKLFSALRKIWHHRFQIEH